MLTKLSQLSLFFPISFTIIALFLWSFLFGRAAFLSIALINLLLIILAIQTNNRPMRYCLILLPPFFLCLVLDIIFSKEVELSHTIFWISIFAIMTSIFLKTFGDSALHFSRKVRWILLTAPAVYLYLLGVAISSALFSNDIPPVLVPYLFAFFAIFLLLYLGMKRERLRVACLLLILAGPVGVTVYCAVGFLLIGHDFEVLAPYEYLYFLISYVVLIPASLIYMRFAKRAADKLRATFD